MQIHVPDTKAPKVISMVGTMLNLVNEVLQSAVGNHFRNTLQDQPAVTFIETRMQVQVVRARARHRVPAALRGGDEGRLHPERALPAGAGRGADQARDREPGEGDVRGAARARRRASRWRRPRAPPTCRAQLASAQVNVEIEQNRADAREAEAQGEAAYVELTGKAEATQVEAIGLANATATEALGVARAEGFETQEDALGETATALVAVANAVSEGHITVVPEVLVTGGGGSFEGLAATLMRSFASGNGSAGPASPSSTVNRRQESMTPDSVDEIIAEAEAAVPEPPRRR